MSEHILLPQPPLTPAQISLGKDVEIRRLNDLLAALSLRWSTEKPTKLGCYWWRAANVRQRVVEVYGHWGTLHINGEGLKTFAGEWAGPISPPEAPQ